MTELSRSYAYNVGDLVRVAIPPDEDSRRALMFHGWTAEIMRVEDDRAYIDTDPPVNAHRIARQAVSFRGWFPYSELVGQEEPLVTFTVLILAYPGPEFIDESSVDAPDRESALEAARDQFSDYIQRGYAVEIRDPDTHLKGKQGD